MFFVANNIGAKSLSPHLDTIQNNPKSLPELRRIVLLSQTQPESPSGALEVMLYSTFVSNGHSVFMHKRVLQRAEKRVKDTDVLNLQFTSGSSSILSQGSG